MIVGEVSGSSCGIQCMIRDPSTCENVSSILSSIVSSKFINSFVKIFDQNVSSIVSPKYFINSFVKKFHQNISSMVHDAPSQRIPFPWFLTRKSWSREVLIYNLTACELESYM
jgi:6-phosphogluconate dehydrogenase